MKQLSGVLFFVSMVLIIGVLIYTTTRTESLYINQWFAYLAGASVLDFLQGVVRNSELPAWVIYSLPDGLWMLGFVLILLLIWDFKIDRRSLPWVGMAIAAGLLFEIFQGLKVIRGTFDVIDLIMILVAACIPLLVIMIKQSASFARLIHLINKYDVR